MTALSPAARCGAALLLAAWVCGPARAAGGGGEDAPATQATQELMAAQQLIERQDWNGAIAELERARHKDFGNAEVHNLLGYSLRKSGRLEQAFASYRKALQLDPKHLGAHEYIGEAYLLANQPGKAREHLAVLARLCNAKCEQYEDLAKAVAAHEGGKPVVQTERR